MSKAARVVVNVLVGLLLAGPLASLTLVVLPEEWRGPVVPWAVAAVAIAVVAFLRQPKRPAD